MNELYYITNILALYKLSAESEYMTAVTERFTLKFKCSGGFKEIFNGPRGENQQGVVYDRQENGTLTLSPPVPFHHFFISKIKYHILNIVNLHFVNSE